MESLLAKTSKNQAIIFQKKSPTFSLDTNSSPWISQITPVSTSVVLNCTHEWFWTRLKVELIVTIWEVTKFALKDPYRKTNISILHNLSWMEVLPEQFWTKLNIQLNVIILEILSLSYKQLNWEVK